MKLIESLVTKLYDALEKIWRGSGGHRLASTTLVICYLVSLILVELNKVYVFPEPFALVIPKNQLNSIKEPQVQNQMQKVSITTL